MENEWRISVAKKHFYHSKRPNVSATSRIHHGVERWHIQPQSIFDYDPLVDGRESTSLSFLNQSNDKTVYEGFGRKEYYRAPQDDFLGIEEIYDPANNHKPVEVTFHPGFHKRNRKSARTNPKSNTVLQETPAWGMIGSSDESCENDGLLFKKVSTSQPSDELLAASSGPVGPNTIAFSPIPLGSDEEFIPPVVPVYSNFNRAPRPFMKN